MNEMPKRWSYSSLSTYESCPAKWHYGYILGHEFVPSPAMVRGTRLHLDCENYLKGNITIIPYELKKVALKLENLRIKGGKSEETWLLGMDWKPCKGEPWIKSIIDVHYVESGVLHVTDFKSGREYPEHREQLELYGLMGLNIYPEVKRVEYDALYLDAGYYSNEGSILRGDIAQAKIERWTSRAIRIFEDKQFLPRPSLMSCRFCDYSHKKGGPCSEGV